MTNGKGDRYFDAKVIVKHLRFKRDIVKELAKRLDQFDPNSCVVHLRGTDRPDGKGDWTQKCIEATKDLTYQVFVVTDQRDLWERYKEAVPHAKLVNPNSCILRIPPSNERGTHQIIPPELKKLNITKRDYVLDVLTDWVALATARQACGRTESTYFEMALS